MKFTKLQATGNDFIMIDARHLEQNWTILAREMCRRRFGIGSDGIILLLQSEVADFKMRMFNPDGSEAEVCGNGLRCFARYVIGKGLKNAHELTIETIAGIRSVESSTDGRFQANMGLPRLKAEDIPVSIDDTDITPILDYPLQIESKVLPLSFVSMGNPHAVYFTGESVADFPLLKLGPIVEHHPIFPQRVNFEVAEIISRREIRARVWERGAGETLSCGSGTCAIAIAALLHNFVDSPVDITLPGGILSVKWDGKGEVWLSGSAEIVFNGEWLQ